MSNIKKPDYCPEWFDLSLYDNLVNFNRNDWIIAIFSRLLPYKEFSKKISTLKDRLDFEKYYISGLVNQIDCVRKKEIELENEVVRNTDLFDVMMEYEKIFLSDNIALQSSFDDIREEILKNKNEFIDGEYRPSDILDLSSRDGISMLLHDKNSLYLNIDLSYSDQAIIEAVKKHLDKARSESENKERQDGKRISDAEIESLIKYRVIPYIDLVLWGMITGNKLTDQKIADILFADDPDGKGLDTIRQTTKKKALKLLSQTRPKFI